MLVGDLDGHTSPARRDTDHSGIDLDLRAGTTNLGVRADYEHALIVMEGALTIDGAAVDPGHLGYLGLGRDELHLAADTATRALLIGGVPVAQRALMWWNFVARTRGEIIAAHTDWMAKADRFGRVDSRLPRIEVSPPPWAHA